MSMLIPCPACTNQVSSMASACPRCAHPIAAAPPRARLDNQAVLHQPVTIEQTSKKHKGGQLVGVMLVCAGFVACSAGEHHGSVWLLLIGVVVFLGARIGAWWSNG